MKTSLRHFLTLGVTLPAATVVGAEAAAGAPPARIAIPAVPISRQIDALLKTRLRPEPLPLDLPNPFILPAARKEGTIVRGGEAANAAALARTNPHDEARTPTNAEILAECAGKLRIGGLMRLKDQRQLVINDVPRKNGDFITITWNNTRIQLVVVSILTDQVVLRYNDAEISLRF